MPQFSIGGTRRARRRGPCTVVTALGTQLLCLAGTSSRGAPGHGREQQEAGASSRGAPGRGREQQEADARHRAAGRLGGSEGPTPLLGAVFVETLHTVVIAGTLRVQALCQAPDVSASLFIRADL